MHLGTSVYELDIVLYATPSLSYRKTCIVPRGDDDDDEHVW